MNRFDLARSLGPAALLRLRAEVLLEHINGGWMDATPGERVRLERMTFAPLPGDREFLGGFDERLAALE